MAKLPWTPWHEVVSVREDLKSGELSLAIFAADLNDVAMGTARPIYQKPQEFFALTYPTFNLRELAKDVVLRLAGKNDKAVRQLELTYGGGKTHTLITLFHLTNEPDSLPELPAVQEFIEHIGMKPPKARIAVLPFDKLDVEKGMEVRAPSGETRWLKHPWSVLAFQLAGEDGLETIGATDDKRDSPPFENLLVDLLKKPELEGLSTLILMDEVLMFARQKVGIDAAWRDKLVDFFQLLTQAATKLDRCAVVASLLATDPTKSDALGKEITQALYSVFRREREEGVEPVVKEDVAEILRRRFFTADSIRDREAFRPHVVAALRGISDVDEQTKKEGKRAEDSFLASYPFHPDLTDVFYTKWTNLEGFQRTRGILRTFALALRDAERWDQSPLVGPNVFLSGPEKDEISEAARELTTTATAEEYEGKKQEWTGILGGELEKARDIQLRAVGLKCREVEQAIFATFLHSQPIGQKALTRELLVLLGATRPDKIDLEKALREWTEISWFLDEAAIVDAEVAPGGEKLLPKSWRLGSRPNLRQMHHDAMSRVSHDLVEAKLLDEIGGLKSLTIGAATAGAKVHNLPERPRDIEDDGEFHYAILSPRAASDSGKPNPEAVRYLEETTTADKPRVYRNAVVLVTPSKDGLEAARNRIREYLGWEEVRSQLKDQEVDPIRSETLSMNVEASKKRIPESIQQAYAVVVTVSEKNETQAFKVTVGGEPLFTVVKNDPKARIQDTPVSAEALLPGGPYDLWREGETSRRVKDLAGAFAQFPQLPKMLRRKEILETLALGAREGFFVLQTIRPDRSVKTYWRQEPDENTLNDPATEVVLPEAAALMDIPGELLKPSRLPGLWMEEEITASRIFEYFAGGYVATVAREGYEERITVPSASRDVVEEGIKGAVKSGMLWLTSGPASLLSEDIPAGLLTDRTVLQSPPEPIAITDILPDQLPEAWTDESSTGLTIATALSNRAGKTLPWSTVRDGIDGAIRARFLELAVDSMEWPVDFSGAEKVKLRLPAEAPAPPPLPPTLPGVLVAQSELRPDQIQDLADQIAELTKLAVGLELKFKLRVELDGSTEGSAEVVVKINALLEKIDEGLRLQ